MAESFAFGLADRVLGKLTSALLQEVGLAWGVKSELEDLQGSLSSIRALLLDAEEKQATNRQLRDWLGKLKDVFYDAEDIVDEFEYEALRQRVMAGGSFKTKVRNFLSSPKSIAFNLRMGHRVKNIKESFDKIAADKSKFSLLEGTGITPVGPSKKREMTHSFVRASDVIGRYDDHEKIVGLLKQCSDFENVSVIPIVGIGGLGKTTLAKLAYNDKRTVEQFTIKMWVCVSDEFEIEKLIKKILKEIDGGDIHTSDLSLEQLQSRLRSSLTGRRFFLVLDDVWNSDRKKWLELKDLLMDGGSGSKILVTTRKRSVAKIMGTVPAHELKDLSHGDCMSLFVKCAFVDGEDRQHPKLLEIGEQIVEKCGGVPLAVRSLGSLLYSKRDERDWVSVRDNEIWESEDGSEDGIMAALRLSYYDLPYHLKQCLALCSLFPKDLEIPNKRLIAHWTAHGLLQSSGQNVRMEDIGERYIQELLSRCFFQDIQQLVRGFCYKFKMHDLVHDLVISFSKPEYSTLSFHTEDIPKKTRHVAVCDGYWPKEEQEALNFLEKLNNIRSLDFQWRECGPRDYSFVSVCVLRYKCIRLLCLNYSTFESLPDSIGTLKHLKLFEIFENRSIKKLPDSICKLYHLQTLMFGGCLELEELPSGIGSMIGLRFLQITSKQRNLLKRQQGLRYLTSLHTLMIVDSPNVEILFKGMRSLIALRELYIGNCPSLVYLPHDIKLLPTLELLFIRECEKFNFMDEKTKRKDIQSFSRLQLLWFENLPQLKTPKWFIQGLGCTTLQRLHISKCPNFKELPENGLQKFPSIEVLEISDCPELKNKCQPEIGEYWKKIAHIPIIQLDGETLVRGENCGSKKNFMRVETVEG